MAKNAPATQPTDDQADDVDFAAYHAHMVTQTAAAVAAGQPAPPMAVGTFTAYATPDGGLILIAVIDDGPLAGEREVRFPAALIRAGRAMASGQGPSGLLGKLLGRIGG